MMVTYIIAEKTKQKRYKAKTVKLNAMEIDMCNGRTLIQMHTKCEQT